MISFNPSDIFLITGASSGIGRAAALIMNELGASIIAVGRNAAKLQSLKNEAHNPDNIFIEMREMTEDIAGLTDWVKSLVKKYGKLKGIILCAGASITEPLKILDYENIKKMMDLNYYAPLMITKAFADKRVNTGVENTIVYVSSFAVHKGNKGQLAYTGSKGAFTASMRTIANELLDKDIRINSVSPSHTDTDMITNTINNCEILHEIKNKYVAKAEDIANIIVFLSSNKSLWINGQDIVANRSAYYYTQEHLNK